MACHGVEMYVRGSVLQCKFGKGAGRRGGLANKLTLAGQSTKTKELKICIIFRNSFEEFVSCWLFMLVSFRVQFSLPSSGNTSGGG